MKKQWQKTMDKYMKMTYANYLSMSTNKTKNYLMISELIDNSISSFEQRHGEEFNKWPSTEVVKIDIEINSNFKNKKKETKHKKKYTTGSFISVSDNAFGMTEEILFKSIELDNTKIIEGSNKNVHGRGMKQASFYFGMTLEINTNNTQQSKKLFVDLTNIDDLTLPFERVVVDSEKKERGTIVKISNIYTNRISDSKRFIKDMLEPLKTRYWNYLSCGKLVINIKGDTNDKEIRLDSKIDKPIFMNISTTSNFYDDENISYDLLKAEVVKKIKSFAFSNSDNGCINDEYKKIIKETVLKTYKDNDELKWEYRDIKCGIFSPIKINITFWRLDTSKTRSGYGPYRGIYIIEGGRFIKHGPNHGAYLEWLRQKEHSTGSTDNIFMGIMDITNIDTIIATNDKSDVEMDQDVQHDLNEFIYWNWKLFDEIENFRRKSEKNNKSFDVKNISAMLTSRYISVSAKNDSALPYSEDIKLLGDKSLEGNFQVHDDLWKISLFSDENETEISKIISSMDIDRREKEIRVSFNERASIWNQAINLKSTEFYGNVLYPIVIQLCILFIRCEADSEKIRASINNEELKLDVD